MTVACREGLQALTEHDRAMVQHWLESWADWMRQDSHITRRIGLPRMVGYARMAPSNFCVGEDDRHAIDLMRHSDQMRRVDAAIDDLGEISESLRRAVYQVHGLGDWGNTEQRCLLMAIYPDAMTAILPILARRGFV